MKPPYQPPEERYGDQPGTLMQRTRALLQKRDCSMPKLARRLDMPVAWLVKFERDEIPAPGVNRVQFLYEQLSGKKLLP